jgi:hypothetical protein
MRKKKKPTDADRLADHAVRLLAIAAELRPYGKRALRLAVQERLMDRIYKDKG